MIPDPLGNLTAMLESALEKSNTLLEGGGLAKVEELLGRLSETDKAGAVLRLAGMPAKKARPKKRADVYKRQDEEKLLELVAHVEAATGMTAKIIGTKPALRKVTTAVVSDQAKRCV